MYEMAISRLDVALRRSTQNTMAFQNHGVAKICIGDIDGAIADFDAAIQVSPQGKNTNLFLLHGIAKELKGELPDEDYATFLQSPQSNRQQIDARRDEFKRLMAKRKAS